MTDTTRPTMLQHTGELDAIKAQAAATVAAYQRSARVPITDFTRAGSMVYFTYAGAPYSLSTLLCSCADLSITLAADGTPRDYLNATYTCPEHGTHQASAIRGAETPAHQTAPAFAWVEQRFRNDRRVQWGMTQRRTP